MCKVKHGAIQCHTLYCVSGRLSTPEACTAGTIRARQLYTKRPLQQKSFTVLGCPACPRPTIPDCCDRFFHFFGWQIRATSRITQLRPTRNILQHKPFTLRQNSFTQHTEHLESRSIIHQRNIFTRLVFRQSLCPKWLLHHKPFTPEALHTTSLLHQKPLHQTLFYTQFTPQAVYIARSLHQKPLTPEILLHQKHFSLKALTPSYTKGLLRHKVL